MADGWEARWRDSSIPGAAEIGGRLLARYHAAAEAVLLRGSTPWEVDAAMESFGFATGPFAEQDDLGVDIGRANRWRWGHGAGGPSRMVPLVDRLLELGKLGRAAGAGWYRYPGGQRVDDPIVADLAVEEAHFGGIGRVDYAPDAIVARLCGALVVEAAALVGAGHDPGAVDRIAVGGLGFPASAGGPLAYGRIVGLDQLRRDLAVFSQENPAVWSVDAGLATALGGPV